MIQAGGLLEKAGVLQALDIELGDDLQDDPEMFERAATLLGALLEVKEQDPFAQHKTLWHQKGKALLGQKIDSSSSKGWL